MPSLASTPEPPGGFPVKTNTAALSETAKDQAQVAIGSSELNVTVYTADGAIPVAAGLAILSKTSAAAMTLAAPTAAQNGIVIEVSAGTDFAHVVTATGLIYDGVTGGAKNTYTTAAFKGSGAKFRAYNGFWHLMAKNLGATA